MKQTLTQSYGDVEREMIDLLASSSRGPRRNGVYCLWLFLRACGELDSRDAASAKAHRKLNALKGRLRSLSLPPGFKKAIAGALQTLETPTIGSAGATLSQLVVPSLETIGKDAGSVVRQAMTLIEKGNAAAP